MSKSYSLEGLSLALSLMLCLGLAAPMTALAEQPAQAAASQRQQMTPQQREAMLAKIRQRMEEVETAKFRALDLDHDGHIDASEIEAAARKDHERMARADAAKGTATASAGRPSVEAHIQTVRDIVLAEDRNGDGRVGLEEFLAGARGANPQLMQ